MTRNKEQMSLVSLHIVDGMIHDKIGLWGIGGRIMAGGGGDRCTTSTTCPRDSLFTANAIRTGLRSRSRLRGDRPAN
jgi:hypothetical protein